MKHHIFIYQEQREAIISWRGAKASLEVRVVASNAKREVKESSRGLERAGK
jgi:hypothetical protein